MLLKRNIFFLSMIVVSVITIITLAFIRYNKSNIAAYSELVHKSMEELLDQQAFNISSHIGADVRTLENIATVLSKYKGDVVVSTDVVQPFLSNSSFDTLFILGLDGNGVVHNGKSIDLSDREYFYRAVKGETVINLPLISRVSGEKILPIATPIKVETEVVGVLVGTYNLEMLERLVLPSYDGNGHTQVVTQNDNLVLSVGMNSKDYHWENSEAQQAYINNIVFVEGSIKEYTEDRENNRSGYLEYIIDKKTMYVHYAPLGINDWYINIAINSGVAFPEIEEMNVNTMNFIYILICCISFIFICIILILFKRYKTTKNIASLDSLTNIYNRGAIEKKITKILSTTKHVNGVLFLIDLDNLKSINDELGHHMGDKSIKDVAKTIDSVLGLNAHVGRIGGDEFLAIVPNLVKSSEIESLAFKINEKLLPLCDGRVNSVSIGVCRYSTGDCFDEIRLKADQAMYYAKRGGKKSFVIWDESLATIKLRNKK
ncbi:MAG: sensor domain-containing diguanylate cyclase [Lachnospiraceae bacterium]